MKNIILNRLCELEAENNVKILYACESGSRAWGFPSANSDYDVRFIYLRPVAWYLSIDHKRDVIEYPVDDDLDISGWDLKKALQLFNKSNPPLLEWLDSPSLYMEKYSIAAQMRSLSPEYYKPLACTFHYMHMAEGNFKEYLRGERIWTKKYFYVLRPILAVQWIQREMGVVPMRFGRLVDELITEPALKEAIHQLLETRQAGDELGYGPRIDIISEFIESELARFEEYKTKVKQPEPRPIETLDALFIRALGEVWGLQINQKAS